jgi:hypothetical protein
MPQAVTQLPTGIRAFNSVSPADASETEILFVKGGDGSQLSLVEIDGHTTAETTFRVYSVPRGFAAPQQIAEFSVAGAGRFNKKFSKVLGAVDEVPVTNLPFKAAQDLGVLGGGGIRITVAITGGGTCEMGATLDKRLDGPFELA